MTANYDFMMKIGPMDWRLFQMQRHTLIRLTSDDRLTDQEQEHLTGLLHLTDDIIDAAAEREIPVPSLDSIVLDLLGDV